MKTQHDGFLDREMLIACFQGVAMATAIPAFLIVVWFFCVAMGA